MMQTTNDCVVEMDSKFFNKVNSKLEFYNDYSRTTRILDYYIFFSLFVKSQLIEIVKIPTPSEDQSESLLYSLTFAFLNPHFILNSPCL